MNITFGRDVALTQLLLPIYFQRVSAGGHRIVHNWRWHRQISVTILLKIAIAENITCYLSEESGCTTECTGIWSLSTVPYPCGCSTHLSNRGW
jgi:hypothetical protein